MYFAQGRWEKNTAFVLETLKGRGCVEDLSKKGGNIKMNLK
jgi:hypothetical protein